MSDAFADLWRSTGASKPSEPPRKLGALATSASTQGPPRKPQNDVFTMLAAAGSSSSMSSRSATPAHSPALGLNTAPHPLQKSSSGGKANVSAGDAFSSLLSGPFLSAQSTGATLTIAQRAALVEKEKEKQERTQQSSFGAPHTQTSSAWAGLDALATTSQQSSQTHVPLKHNSLATSPSTAREQSKSPYSFVPDDDDWGFGDFISQPVPALSPNSKTSAISNILDLDDFMAAPAAESTAVHPRPTSFGEFDFGDREDGLLHDQSDIEDDILGDLGKPVEHLAARRSARNTPSPQPPQSGQQSRAVSPPPHILGQIVEMGFSIQQARVALAATDTGIDVQAALDMLLSNGAAPSSPTLKSEQERQRRPRREPGHERYYGPDEEDEHPRRPQRQSTKSSTQPQTTRERPDHDGTPPAPDTQRNLQEQADKIIAQASEIGLNMFNRANAFWKEGKERVQKAYEERAAAPSGSSRQNTGDAPMRNGRPKWMQDAPEDAHVPEVVNGSGGLKDDDGDGPPSSVRPQAKQPPRAKQQQQRAVESPGQRLKVGNLFSDDAPSAYISPFRRKTPVRTQSSADPPTSPASAPKSTPARAPSPLVQRNTVSAVQSAISASAQQKAAGTEKFKLGQYGEAEASYSTAIAALPDNHLLLVPLYNNRALTRLRNGDTTGAIADCTTVVTLVGRSYHPAREAKVTRAEEGAGVDLADALLKAWRRRAEAYEGKEKWELAKLDWEVLAGVDFAGPKLRADASAGIGRCRRMLNAGGNTAPAPAARPSVPVRPQVRVPTPPSEALDRVREVNVAAEAEDQAKHELKDVLDARLATWRAGKENNIRALIASLDTVLWPELGWQKVGIHELVSPSQVKIRYTKAIAKLHPDKLNVRNTTLEQRMIANGVFGSLNEAWNVFKP